MDVNPDGDIISAMAGSQRQDFRDSMKRLQNELRREERHHLFEDALKKNFIRTVAEIGDRVVDTPISVFRWMVFQGLSNNFWPGSIPSADIPQSILDATPVTLTAAFRSVDVRPLTTVQIINFMWYNGNSIFDWMWKVGSVEETPALPLGHDISNPIDLEPSRHQPSLDDGENISNPIVLSSRSPSPSLPRTLQQREQEALAKAEAEAPGGLSKKERRAVRRDVQREMGHTRRSRKKRNRGIAALLKDIKDHERSSNQVNPLPSLAKPPPTLSYACRPGVDLQNQAAWMPSETSGPSVKGPPLNTARIKIANSSQKKEPSSSKRSAPQVEPVTAPKKRRGAVQIFDWTQSGWVERNVPSLSNEKVPDSTNAAAGSSSQLADHMPATAPVPNQPTVTSPNVFQAINTTTTNSLPQKSQPQPFVPSASSGDNDQSNTNTGFIDRYAEFRQKMAPWSLSGWVPQRPVRGRAYTASTGPLQRSELLTKDKPPPQEPRPMPPSTISLPIRIERPVNRTTEGTVEAATRDLVSSSAEIPGVTKTLASEEVYGVDKSHAPNDASCVDTPSDQEKGPKQPDHVSQALNADGSGCQQLPGADETDYATVQEELDAQLAADMSRMTP
ncbi:hypothetical protein F5B20DRAFT_588859 [Whalleya microplaca]|nr:hypothetical protein F5B20DRAFT_588859 [Whalleya microplaca]